MAAAKRARKFGVRATNLKGRPAREAGSEASSEDERELSRLLALINGRGRISDREPKEDRR